MKKKKEKIIIHGICQCESCKKIREGNRKNIIFMDPPYHGVNANALYGGKKWKEIDYVKLRNNFHETCCAGFSVILTMSNTPFIRELFRGYNMKKISGYSGVSRKKVDELIITNLYDEELKRISKKTLKKGKKIRKKK